MLLHSPHIFWLFSDFASIYEPLSVLWHMVTKAFPFFSRVSACRSSAKGREGSCWAEPLEEALKMSREALSWRPSRQPRVRPWAALSAPGKRSSKQRTVLHPVLVLSLFHKGRTTKSERFLSAFRRQRFLCNFSESVTRWTRYMCK